MNRSAVKALQVECSLEKSIVENLFEVDPCHKRIENSKLFKTAPAMLFGKRDYFLMDDRL